jgi:membrane protease YdiL (CAAX protease family)
VPELPVASGPFCGAALFVFLSAGRLPHARSLPLSRALALRWLWLGLVAGLEELVWRAGALASLALATGPAVALVLTSAGFALWHRPALGRRCTVHLATGLGFGATFLVGGLAAAILAHAVYNVLVDWAVHTVRRES